MDMLKNFRELTSAKDIRLKNVYRQIRKYQKIDINQLKDITGYKHATCVRLLDELLENDLIDDTDLGDSSGGRPPKLYKINATNCYLIGIDIGYLFIKIVLLNLNLEICQIKKIPVNKEATPENTLLFIQESIELFLKNEKIAPYKILGIGLGILPKYHRETFVLDENEPFVKFGWSGFNIKSALEKATGYQVFVESGMNLSALAEYRKHYFGNSESLLFISNDVTLKSSAIINGKFLYQKDEEIDGIGHMVIDLDGNECTCGLKGCLGTYCTLPVLHEKIKNNHEMPPTIDLSYSELIEKKGCEEASKVINSSKNNDNKEELKIDFKQLTHLELIEKIDEGHPLFVEESNKLAYYFGIGVSNMILQMHPDVVIIGGTLGIRMYEEVIEIVKERLSPLNLDKKTVINVMNSDFNSVSEGAGCLVFDYFIEEDNSLDK